MFWGLTPALDLQAEYKSELKLPMVLNILIVGSTDARHILKTLSKSYRHETIEINIYVVELSMELVARQILFLNIALQPMEAMGFYQKIKIFMELFGNTLVRPAIAKYLTSKAGQLVEMITDLDYCYTVMKNINLDNLKYTERDYLEILFKYWCASDPFFICELWDRRVRKFLTVRYDAKMGVFDWDLHMRLHSAGANQICPQEYKHWRETGVGFTWLDSDVSKPNRTLVAGVVPSGAKFLHHGYIGDIITGPFIPYGLQCENEEMLKQMNKMNINRASDVTEYNLKHMFYELLNNEECSYETDSNNLKMGIIVVDLPKNRIVENQMDLDAAKLKKCGKPNDSCVYLENVKINFMSISNLDRMKNKQEFYKQFNIIYFASTLIDKLDPENVSKVADDKCLLIIENQKYVPSCRSEDLDELGKKITAKTSMIENINELPFNPKADVYAKFIINL